jgi:FkbM family methyltransferase
MERVCEALVPAVVCQSNRKKAGDTMTTDNPHNIPLPESLRKAIRKVALKGYTFATPYLNSPIPFKEDRRYVQSYSYHGEDLLLDALLWCKPFGRYIDIGANDPVFRNNTKRFSLRGWKGINIEPHPEKFTEIQQDRPMDINLNIALSDKDSEAPFYALNWEMASTLDKELALKYCKEFNTTIREVIQIPTMRFDTMMEKYSGNVTVDFVSMDIEKHELVVLKTNNWDRYRPSIFCIELCYDLAESVSDYMISKGYHPVFMTEENGFYVDEGLL